MKKIITLFGKIPLLIHLIILFGGNIIAVMINDLTVILTINIIWVAIAALGVISQFIKPKP